MFEEGRFSTKRWRRHLVRNEGVEVDDFQYGRDGHKNRPPGRYPLRLWGRNCDGEASAALREGSSARPDATTSAKSGTTEAITGGNALGNGQPNIPPMAEKPSVSQMMNWLKTVLSISDIFIESNASSILHHSHSNVSGEAAESKHPQTSADLGATKLVGCMTLVEATKAQVLALPVDGRLELLEMLLPSLPVFEQERLLQAYQTGRRSDGDPATILSKDLDGGASDRLVEDSTEPFPLLDSGDFHQRWRHDEACSSRGESLPVSKLILPATSTGHTAMLLNECNILPHKDKRRCQGSKKMGQLQEAADELSRCHRGFKGSMRGLSKRLSRTFHLPQD